jgi:hypothetical protein
MTDKNFPREIAERIISGADSSPYLAEALGKSALPDAWCYGPSLEVRVRFQRRLRDINDADLAHRLAALDIDGPLSGERLSDVASRLSLQPGDLAMHLPWRPRGFGLWRLESGIVLGVKVYASSRHNVDLLLAVPPRFFNTDTGCTDLPHWMCLAAHPDELSKFARLSAALSENFKRAQGIAQVEAVQVQDQTWCQPFTSDDRGFLLPQVVVAAWGGKISAQQDGWTSLNLT